MQGAPLPIHQQPEKTDPQYEKIGPSKHEAQGALRQREQTPVWALSTKPPSDHTKGLSTASPEPSIEAERSAYHHEKDNRVLQWVSYYATID
tara:strand:- start:38 stop:313 length:276 start_codon:yes stop_codon:yes gene_type:complete